MTCKSARFVTSARALILSNASCSLGFGLQLLALASAERTKINGTFIIGSQTAGSFGLVGL